LRGCAEEYWSWCDRENEIKMMDLLTRFSAALDELEKLRAMVI